MTRLLIAALRLHCADGLWRRVIWTRASPTVAITPFATATATSTAPFVMPPRAASIPESCQVTRPFGPDRVPEAAAKPLVDGSSHPTESRRALTIYGNDAIWVIFPANGVAKLWESSPTVRLIEGVMTASIQRTDSRSPPIEVPVISGYGRIGFQAFAVEFPEPGCWEVTQRLSGKELRFTIWVER